MLATSLFQLSYALVWALAIILVPISVVLLYLLAQLQVQAKTDGAGFGNNLIGREMPICSAKDIAGRAADIRVFAGKRHVALLVSPDCGTCRRLITASLTSDDGERGINLLLLFFGDVDRVKAVVGDSPTVPVFVQDEHSDSTMDLWYAGFPAALLIDEDGCITDVRHPMTFKGLKAVVNNASTQDPSYALHRRFVPSGNSAASPS